MTEPIKEFYPLQSINREIYDRISATGLVTFHQPDIPNDIRELIIDNLDQKATVKACLSSLQHYLTYPEIHYNLEGIDENDPEAVKVAIWKIENKVKESFTSDEDKILADMALSRNRIGKNTSTGISLTLQVLKMEFPNLPDELFQLITHNNEVPYQKLTLEQKRNHTQKYMDFAANTLRYFMQPRP